jgi:hypothetical protein
MVVAMGDMAEDMMAGMVAEMTGDMTVVMMAGMVVAMTEAITVVTVAGIAVEPAAVVETPVAVVAATA